MNEEVKNLSLYTLTRIKGDAPLSVYCENESHDGVIATGNDLNELSDRAYSIFHEKYEAIDSYDAWLSLSPDRREDLVISDVKVGEIFRASILIEDDTRRAFALAQKYHRDQTRKGGGQQYIIHIMMISQMLWTLLQYGKVDRPTLLAGICHDLLEDTTCNEEEIAQVCGQEVLRIVKAVSSDPQLEDAEQWEQKKQQYIVSVEDGGSKAMIVALCDKIVNMRSLFAEYDIEGSSVWTHFNRGKEKKVWFEKNVLSMLQKHLSTPILSEYEIMITRLEKLDGGEK